MRLTDKKFLQNSSLRFLLVLLLAGTALNVSAQNCDVDFPGAANILFSAACGTSPDNVTLGKNTNFGNGDVLTFDASVTIDGNVAINGDGSGKIIIPAGVTVEADGNFQMDSKSGGCTTGSPCLFEIVVNGTLHITGNFSSDLTTVVWSGTGTVIFDDKFDNKNNGCMQCGTGGCPNIQVDPGDCDDSASGCAQGDFCSTITACANDITAPIIMGCPGNMTVPMTGSGCTQTVNWIPPTAQDNCSLASFTSTHSPGFAFPKGPTIVTYTARDAKGNSATCSFTVTVNDLTAPVITGCPTNITVNTNAGCGAVVNWAPASFTDNCTGGTITSVPVNGSTFPVGPPTTVTYTATDASGNTATCSFTVTVVDNVLPVITGCPANMTVNANAACGAVVNWTPPSFTDNCTGGTLTSVPVNGSTFPVGPPTTVIYTATDAAGNSASCSFTVTVVDNTPPAFSTCPTDITVAADPESCDASVNWTLPTATDNCSGSVSLTNTHDPGNTFEIASTPVRYTATDLAGLSAECVFNVIVRNETIPVISDCPSDITARADESGVVSVTWVEPTASVACGEVTLESTYDPGYPFEVGETEVVYTANTLHGKTATCKFIVKVTADIQFDITPVVTPNGDGDNDYWKLTDIEKFEDNRVVVADRWGNVVYKASGYNNENVAWKGENTQGSLVPTGTYFYTILVNFKSTRVEKRGSVEVIR